MGGGSAGGGRGPRPWWKRTRFYYAWQCLFGWYAYQKPKPWRHRLELAWEMLTGGLVWPWVWVYRWGYALGYKVGRWLAGA